MADEDSRHWNERYSSAADPSSRPISPAIPSDFAEHAHRFPMSGRALDVACGTGAGCLWLAQRGLDVIGIDISAVAIDAATDAAHRLDLSNRCRFVIADLDDGIPDTPPADVIMCHRFRLPALYEPMVERLAVGGLLAIAVLSEVGSAPGRFRAEPGELRRAFGHRVDVLVDREGAGTAMLIGIKSG